MNNKKIYLDEGLILALATSLALHLLVPILIPSLAPIAEYILIALAFAGVVPVIISAIRALIRREITIDLLASIALVFTLLGHQWVSAVFINLMLASARLFGAFTERRTTNIVSHLLKLRPSVVKVQTKNQIHEIDIDQIKVGDLVVIESGERIAIDGVVVKGQASVDQSTLTGESEAVLKKEGAKVFSSTLCVSGSLVVKTEKVGADTTLSKMISLVSEASRAKTKTETIANTFSTWYISIMLLGSAVLYYYTKNVNLVLSILLVTCADDIAVAIPLGFSVAIAKAAKHGIIVKGAKVMERVRDIRTIVTDKTGTLTRGIAKVVSVEVSGDEKRDNVLRAGAYCAIDSSHPISRAIIEYAHAHNVAPNAPDETHEFPGEGVTAKHTINGVAHEYAQGKVSFVKKLGVSISADFEKRIRQYEDDGNSVSIIVIDKKAAGFFVLQDIIRPYAKEIIRETRCLGVEKWIMLTGDNKQVAARVSKTLGIDEFYSELKPEGKVEMIKSLRKKHGAVAMIGDGVNDAASLALADVSFAMGSIGSDASIEAADIAIMHDDLRRIPESILLSQKSIRIVKQNFAIWFITNVVGLGLVFGGFLGPVGASAYNFLTDFLPILNVYQIYYLTINRHSYDDAKKPPLV